MKTARLLTLLLLLSGVLVRSPAEAAVTVVDDAGRKVTLTQQAKRIASLAPGATEMLFAAGAGSSVIATVQYSDEPEAARRVPRIGDALAIDMERLVAAKPDVIVVWSTGGNPAQIAKVERLGIPVYHQQVSTLSDMPASLRRLGRLAGTEAEAEKAARAIETRLERLSQKYAGRKLLNVFLQIWDRPIYTIGGTHLVSDALRLCGARNVFADLREPGPAVEIESIIARNPDVIIAVSSASSAGRWIEDWKRFAGMRAVRTGKLAGLDDERLTRLGPSAIDATEALCEIVDANR